MKSVPQGVRAGLAVSAIVFFGVSPALAAGTAEQRAACMGDAFRFCSAYIPDATGVETCLRHNVDSLVPACRAEFQSGGKTSAGERRFR